MKQTINCVVIALAATVLFGCAARAAEKKIVQVRYTGTLADGTVFDSTEKRQPLELMIGEGFWIPKLEKALIGMKVGEKKRVVVPAADAFGAYNPEIVEEVEKVKFADGIRFEIGLEVQTITPEGPTLARIIEVRPATVIVDYNHPLAGKDLTFDMEIVKIRSPTKAELDRLGKKGK